MALFRAASDATATASRLAEFGLAAALAPVLAPVSLAAPVPEGPFDAAAVTSAKALDHAAPDLIRRLTELPIHVVGTAGRRAAERRGLEAASEAPDAESLARELVSTLRPGARLLYLAGVDRKAEFEAALRAARLEVVTLEVYLARARAAWTESEAEAVANADIALHYSRRSAELATQLAGEAGLAGRWRSLAHVTISEDTAIPLRAAGVAVILVAASPDEAAMLERISGEAG